MGVSTQISFVSRPQRGAQRVEVALVDQVVREPEPGEHLVDEPIGAAVEVLRQDEVVTGVQRRRQQRVGGGHPTGEGARLSALELAERALEGRSGRVG